MKTVDFIRRTYRTGNTERQCSSVITDSEGVVYSYGRHYPLLIGVAELDFVNTSGYSNTTNRHINWAKQAVDYEYIAVELYGDDRHVVASAFNDDGVRLKVIMEALTRMQQKLIEEIDKKKRTTTAIYRDLQTRLERVTGDLNKVARAYVEVA